jgi:hypothetical protein
VPPAARAEAPRSANESRETPLMECMSESNVLPWWRSNLSQCGARHRAAILHLDDPILACTDKAFPAPPVVPNCRCGRARSPLQCVPPRRIALATVGLGSRRDGNRGGPSEQLRLHRATCRKGQGSRAPHLDRSGHRYAALYGRIAIVSWVCADGPRE